MISTSLTLRRHSLQGDCPCEIFEQQIAKQSQHQQPTQTPIICVFAANAIESNGNAENIYERLLNRSALTWLKNINIKRNPMLTESMNVIRLRRSSSENVLLLSPQRGLNRWPIVQRSFSSGLVF